MSEVFRRNAFRDVLGTWPLLAIAVTLSLLGVITVHPFDGSASLAPRQLVFIGLGIVVYTGAAMTDLRFIRRTPFIIASYVTSIGLLCAVLLAGSVVQGAKSWFNFGFFSFQPSDIAKLVVIALLAKYYSRRHMEIGQLQHIIISGIYVAAIVVLVIVQPDLGTAVILLALWFGMVLVSGISKKHLAVVIVCGILAATGLWFFGLHDYQRTRILAFVNPAADIHGSGYNAYQATVAEGSGQLFGKGIGYGTQSKLRFLPVYETDFIFAAFAEEWGFVGVVLLLALYALLIFQLLKISRLAATNFDALFAIGVAILFMAHVATHAGINLGLLPVTGTTIPFMSAGGSHLMTEFLALGIVASLAQQGRSVPRDVSQQEYEG